MQAQNLMVAQHLMKVLALALKMDYSISLRPCPKGSSTIVHIHIKGLNLPSLLENNHDLIIGFNVDKSTTKFCVCE